MWKTVQSPDCDRISGTSLVDCISDFVYFRKLEVSRRGERRGVGNRGVQVNLQ
jgi:hypothetical protein